MIKRIIRKFQHRKEVKVDELIFILSRTKNEEINTIIDLGAAAGTWCKRALNVYKNQHYLLVEPIEERLNDLKALKAQYKNSILIEQVVVSSETGEVNFTVTDDLDGSGMYGSGNLRKVKAEKLDDLVNNHALKGSFLLKFDTHGFEMPIIMGAVETIKQTEIIVMETYNFKISPDALKFWEMCKIMDDYGFRPFDLIEILRRNKDGALWQFDIIFLRKENPIFQTESFV